MKERICACGCGQTFIPKDYRSKYIRGHLSPEAKKRRDEKMRASHTEEYKEKARQKALDFYRNKKKASDSYPLCACGCGERVKNRNAKFIGDHYLRVPGYMEELKRKRNLPEVKEKIKQTCLERYGVDNPSKCKEVVDKISQTIQDRYGVEWATQKSDFREKTSQTCMEKYGVDWQTKAQEVKDKSKKTCLEKFGTEYYQQCDESKEHYKELSQKKYGTDYAFQSEEVKDKIKDTLMERYGVENIMDLPGTLDKIKEINLERFGVEWSRQNKDIIEKGKQTCIEKYGVDNPGKCPDIIEKGKQTCLEKYGSTNIWDNEEIRKKALEKIKDLSWEYILRHSDTWIPQFTKDEFHGWLEKDTENKLVYYPFKCAKCGNIQNISRYYTRCRRCNPYVGRSHSEVDVENFIKSLNIVTEHSNRTILSNNREIDIYIPSKNLAIEFDGLYWHSVSNNSDENFHLNKTEECLKHNIQLIHIMEDEWLNKQDIVKSRIKNLLGMYDKVIYARKCIVRDIVNKQEYIDFLEHNHLQGTIGSKFPIGLYYENELVALMTFGSYRKSLGQTNIENCYEMYRFCNKCGYHIPGAASKLFKYFISKYNPIQIISYADRRWSNGNLYNKLGFRLDHISRPNYWYIDPTYSYREYRFKYRKSELPKLLECFDPEETEQQNMLNNGFDIIYDCGNFVFKWNREEI